MKHFRSFKPIRIGEKGRVYKLIDRVSKEQIEYECPYEIRKEAFEKNKLVMNSKNENSEDIWELVDENEIKEIEINEINNLPLEIIIKNSDNYCPTDLIMTPIHWKLLLRSVLRGKNILMVGNSGSGKTHAAYSVSKVLKRPFFTFNLGATQDPRASLIGNTFFNNEKGTYHSASEFIKAIQTENAVILLDELSRAHPEAHNILMSVLDPGQRYVRLDEAEKQEKIFLAKGVCFIATANIGSQYTTTKTLDRATLDRFTIVEMVQLTGTEELTLVYKRIPELNTELYNQTLESFSKIVDNVRSGYNKGELNNFFSTRMYIDVCELLLDGFSLQDSLEVTMIPLFENDGMANSEQSKVRKIIQRHIVEIPAVIEYLDGNKKNNKTSGMPDWLDDLEELSSSNDDQNPFSFKNKKIDLGILGANKNEIQHSTSYNNFIKNLLNK